MALLKSIKGFVMSVIDSLQEVQQRRALKYTRSYRLEKYIESKGCHDVSCVEHWVNEFYRNESKNGI